MTNTHTTSNGTVIPIQAFSQFLAVKVRESGIKKAEALFPAVLPTYDVPLMGGGVQTFAHDAKSIEGDEAATAAWTAYQKALKAQAEYCSMKMTQFCITTGVVLTVPEDGAWREEQEFYGVEIPTNPSELKFHYVTTVLVPDARDITNLMQSIMQASGLSDDILSAGRAQFRDPVRQPEEPDAARQSVGDDGGSEIIESLVDSAEVHGISSNGTMETDPLPMGFVG